MTRTRLTRGGLLLAAITLGVAACVRDPSADISVGQTIIEVTDAINDLRQDNALLQEQIDSLSANVARQDSLVRQLANMAGMPVSR